MRGAEFAELRAFVMVVEQRNFARAAAHLRISPSTLSQTIRELEERLGIRLLNRTTRSLSLTEAGERLFQRFRPALSEMLAAVEDLRNLRERPAGTVKLHISRPASVTLVEPLLGRFHETHPDIVLDMTLDDAAPHLVEGGYDVGIRIGELLEQDMVAIRLGGDIRQVAVASPDYLARHGVPKTPADLLAHRCINWRWPGRSGIYAWEFLQEGRWISVAVNGPLVVSHRDAALSAALQGVGIALWTETMVGPYVRDGRLVLLLDEYCGHFPGWHLCYPRQRHTPPQVRAFIDFMRQAVPAA